jgi:hypothetical protein
MEFEAIFMFYLCLLLHVDRNVTANVQTEQYDVTKLQCKNTY